MSSLRYRASQRQATWLELFFDLVFVAVIGVATHDLAHTHHGHISTNQFLRFPLVFIPVWWIWTTHTLYANRFDNDDRFHRLFALVIMGLLVALSGYAQQSHDKEFLQFTLLYASIRVLLATLYLKVHLHYKQRVNFANGMAQAILVGAVISASAVLMTGVAKFIVFYLGIAIDMLLQLLLRNKTKHLPVDRKHLVERIGLLAIIILGESVIRMVASLVHTEISDTYAIVAAMTGFAMVWAIWWIYFDSFGNLERAKRITDGNVLIYTHLVLCMGLLILANLIGHSIKRDLDQETFRLLAITGMCGFYFGKQVIYFVCFPPFRKMILVNTAVCITITMISTTLPRIEYSLIGMTLGMLFYVYSTYRWLLPNNIDQYTVSEAPSSPIAMLDGAVYDASWNQAGKGSSISW